MASVSVADKGADRAPEWSRKYPPLFALVVALLIAVLVLPSSLTLPQTNPTETLEYAPVPPDQNVNPPPQPGNLSSLGLGTSSAIEGGGAPGGDEAPGPAPAPPPPAARGINPVSKRCVGNPPRQTEDPTSPPCVAFFDGDNFGETYQGVTGEEIRLLVYFDGGIAELGTSSGQSPRPRGKYFDLFAAPDPADEDENHLLVRGFRAWQIYFNDRFQTYNRRVHFFLYFNAKVGTVTPEERRADAADNFAKVKPFAVLTTVQGNEDVYLEFMARKGVLNFGSFGQRPQSFFQQFPKLVWGYQPSLEQQVQQYSTYVCQKVVGKPPVLAAPDIQARAAGTRKLGQIFTTDKAFPNFIKMSADVRQKVQACGGAIEAEAGFAKCCFAQDASGDPDTAAAQMAQFKQANVTTILWTGGIEGNYGRAAQAIGYYPEFVVVGDGTMDGNNPIRLAGLTPNFDGRAFIVTPEVYEPALEQRICAQAYREADNQMPSADLNFVCEYYRNLFQFFVGVQVAGPRLGPTSIDRGFHAIPAIPSTNAQTPACYYEPNDYTCVKDAQAEVYDAEAQAPGDSRPGCWRSIEIDKPRGNRYLPGRWPAGNIDAQLTGREPCNGHNTSALLRRDPTER